MLFDHSKRKSALRPRAWEHSWYSMDEFAVFFGWDKSTPLSRLHKHLERLRIIWTKLTEYRHNRLILFRICEVYYSFSWKISFFRVGRNDIETVPFAWRGNEERPSSWIVHDGVFLRLDVYPINWTSCLGYIISSTWMLPLILKGTSIFVLPLILSLLQ